MAAYLAAYALGMSHDSAQCLVSSATAELRKGGSIVDFYVAHRPQRPLPPEAMTMTLPWKRGLMLVGALAGLFAAAPARAEQIVLFDITYTHTNANDSHHSISGAALNQPANWTSPIDYSKGTIHFYQEVMTKPSNKPTIIDFCLISARDYGCIETFIYTHTGLHETMRSMAGGDVDKRNVIDFTQRMRSIQMVLKTPAPTWINGGRPQSDYLPSMMRFVATLVSPGGTYVAPKPAAWIRSRRRRRRGLARRRRWFADGRVTTPGAAPGQRRPGRRRHGQRRQWRFGRHWRLGRFVAQPAAPADAAARRLHRRCRRPSNPTPPAAAVRGPVRHSGEAAESPGAAP